MKRETNRLVEAAAEYNQSNNAYKEKIETLEENHSYVACLCPTLIPYRLSRDRTPSFDQNNRHLSLKKISDQYAEPEIRARFCPQIFSFPQMPAIFFFFFCLQ